MTDLSTTRYLLRDTPPIPCLLKERPEDFLVEELPLYEPSGQGEHLMLLIEKTGLSTTDALRMIARNAQVSNGAVGYAGMKDKHAVTRQHVTIHLPGKTPADDQQIIGRFTRPDLKVGWAVRHHNKLRLGHLAGNRFVIRARHVRPTDVVHAKRALDALAARGVPNYFGPQRFGAQGENARLGALLLKSDFTGFLNLLLGQPPAGASDQRRAAVEAFHRADYAAALELTPRPLRHERQALDALRQGKDARAAVMSIHRLQRDFFLSALQSDLFNRTLSRRLDDSTFDKLLPGDLAFLHGNRAVFSVDQATADLENSETGRVRAFEVSPSGPMWGPKMLRPQNAVAALEQQALADLGLTEPDFSAPCDTGQLTGERRPLRIPIFNHQISAGVDEHGPFIKFIFDLPRSGYATTVLEQVTKTSLEPNAADGPAEPDGH